MDKIKLTLLFIMLSVFVLSGCVMYVAAPPRISVPDDAELYVIPGTYVYYYQVDNNDVYFCDGIWWTTWHNHWYRGENGGYWKPVENHAVAADVINLPNGWKNSYVNSIRVRWDMIRL